MSFEAGPSSSTSRFQAFKARYQGFDSYTKQVMNHNNVFDSANSGETRGGLGTMMAKVCHVVLAVFIDIGRYVAYVVKGGKFDNQDSKFLNKKEGEYTYSWNRSISTQDKASQRAVALAKKVMGSDLKMYATQLLGGAKEEGPDLLRDLKKGLEDLSVGVSRFEFIERSLSELEGALKGACTRELPGYSTKTDVISLRDNKTPLAKDLFNEIENATGLDATGRRSNLGLLKANAKIYDIQSDFNNELVKENSSALQAQNNLVSQLNKAAQDNIITPEERNEVLSELRRQLETKGDLYKQVLIAAVNDAETFAKTQDELRTSSNGVTIEDVTGLNQEEVDQASEAFYDFEADGEDIAKAVVRVDLLAPFRFAASKVAKELAGDDRFFKKAGPICEEIARGLAARAEAQATREKQKAEEVERAAKAKQAADEAAEKERAILGARAGLSLHLLSNLEMLNGKENELLSLLNEMQSNIVESESNLTHVQEENGRANFTLNKALQLSERIAETPNNAEISFDGILDGISLEDVVRNVEQHLKTEKEIGEKYESILKKINDKLGEIESIKGALLEVRKNKAENPSFDEGLKVFNQLSSSHLEMFNALIAQKQDVENRKDLADFTGLKQRLEKLNNGVEQHRKAARAFAKPVNGFSDAEIVSFEEMAIEQEEALKAEEAAKAVEEAEAQALADAEAAKKAEEEAEAQALVDAALATVAANKEAPQAWGNYLWSFLPFKN